MTRKADSVSPDPGTKRPIDFKWLPIDSLIPNAWNINVQDATTFELLQDEIASVGLIDPIEVVPLQDGTYQILGGEHRWKAAGNLGHLEVPCVLLTDTKFKDEDLKKFVSVRMNIIHGKMDPDKFLTLYNEMASKYGADALQRLFGYTDSKAFQKMLGWVKKGLKQTLPKEMAAQVDDATKDVKSVEDLGNIIQNLFNQYGDTLSHSFMVFTYGKQQHVYIQMTAAMRRAMDKVMDFCRVTSADINTVLLPVIVECGKKAALELEKQKQQEAVDGSSVVAPKKSEW